MEGGATLGITMPRRLSPHKTPDRSPLALFQSTGLASTTIWVRGQMSTSASSPRTRLTTSGITSTCRASPTSAYTPWPSRPATHVCFTREGGLYFGIGGAISCMVLQRLGCAGRSACHNSWAHEIGGSIRSPSSWRTAHALSPCTLPRAAVIATRRFDVRKYVDVGPVPEAMEIA